MWIPKSAADVEEAARRGDLEETHTFDAKAGLPSKRKNHDLAVDVAAMAVDGGVLLYGLGEDGDKKLTVLSPIPLAGTRERVAQIVQTSISEAPFIDSRLLPKDDDTSRGFLVVVVPQSERAPHQVIVGDDMRYYGRGSTGNRILAEGEIAGLYARRAQWEVDRRELLDRELSKAPPPQEGLGYLHAFARPVVPDDSMVERVTASGKQIKDVLLDGARSWGRIKPARHGGDGYAPDFRRATYVWRRGADGWAVSTERDDGDEPQYTARLDLDFNGTGHFFCGRIATTTSGQPSTFVLFEGNLAGNLASFLAAMGAFYDAAGYVGVVDVGVAVTGIQGSIPFELIHGFHTGGFAGADPKRTTRTSAAELSQDAKGLTLLLIGRLFDTIRGTEYQPFADDETASA